MIRSLFVLLAANLLVAAEGLAVERAWSRASAPGQTTGAIYGNLRNSGATADRLIAAECALATTVEVHEHSKGPEGVMQMRAVAGGLAVPGNASLELKPGSYHLMLFGLKQALVKGGEVPLTFVFEKAGRIEVKARINPAWAMGFDEVE